MMASAPEYCGQRRGKREGDVLGIRFDNKTEMLLRVWPLRVERSPGGKNREVVCKSSSQARAQVNVIGAFSDPDPPSLSMSHITAPGLEPRQR
jgi:hypothetical protein